MRLKVDRMATGGEAVGRDDDGRVVFVRGALPGETVAVEITDNKRRFGRGVVTEVLDGSADRRDEPCPHRRGPTCGGCDWQHIDGGAQRRYKTAILVDQLERLGGLVAPEVTHHAGPRGRRTTMRCAVVAGRAGLRARRSSSVQALDECGASHPLIEELIVDGRFGEAEQVTLRVGAGTDQRMVILHGGSPERVRVPDDVVVVADDPAAGSIEAVVAGRRWRVSAGSFFQTSDLGTEHLVAVVQNLAGASAGPIVDLYSGVGLLGGSLGTPSGGSGLIAAVEASSSCAADARHNLGPGVEVIKARVDQWKPAMSCQLVIADPARRGLEAAGLATVTALDACDLVLVSCDPASLGRDAGLLRDAGWSHRTSVVIDMFPDTSRIEAVSRFTRSA